MNKIPLISIVLPSYNSMKYIDGCLSAIFKSNYKNFELILINDASTDESISFVKNKYGKDKRLQIYHNKKNLKLGGSRALGISKSKGEFIAFLDCDMYVDSNWLNEALKVFEKDNKLEIGAVQGKVRALENKKILNHCGIKIVKQIGWIVANGAGYEDTGIFDKKQKWSLCGFNCALVRKAVFKRIGPSDKYLGMNVDDVDLGMRMWVAGYKTIINPKMIGYHPITQKSKEEREVQMKLITWEFEYDKMFRVFLKNYSRGSFICYFPQWMIFTIVRSFYKFFRGNSAPLIGLSKSLIWNIRMLPDTLGERKRVQKLRKFDDNKIFDHISLKGSLYWNFRFIIYPQIIHIRSLSIIPVKNKVI
jgi:GT2 family glycosyltransferase